MKTFDPKTKKAIVVFKEYKLDGAHACPECHRPFKQWDLDKLEANGRMSCLKCGAKLIK